MKFFDLFQRIIQSIWAENAAHCNSEKQRQIQRDSGMGWVAQSPMCKLCQLLTSAAFCWLSSQWGLLPVQCASLQMPPVVLFPEEIAQHGPICKELFKESSGGGKKEGRKKKTKNSGMPCSPLEYSLWHRREETGCEKSGGWKRLDWGVRACCDIRRENQKPFPNILQVCKEYVTYKMNVCISMTQPVLKTLPPPQLTNPSKNSREWMERYRAAFNHCKSI